mgnify:CR=1 FL=1
MDEVSKSKLKAKMFEYFRRIETSKRPLVVKDFGEPVLVIYPYQPKLPIEELFKPYRNKARLSRQELLSPEMDEWGSEI